MFATLKATEALTLLTISAFVVPSTAFIITGQLQCDGGFEAKPRILLGFETLYLDLDARGYFILDLPENQTISLSVFHHHCYYEPIMVKTYPADSARYIFLSGISKYQKCWWRTKSMMVFFLLNFLAICTFWFMAKYRKNVVVVRSDDVEVGRQKKDWV
ncbi:hypothetical protein D910_06667 [Dendroctonus ponderosae]